MTPELTDLLLLARLPIEATLFVVSAVQSVASFVRPTPPPPSSLLWTVMAVVFLDRAIAVFHLLAHP